MVEDRETDPSEKQELTLQELECGQRISKKRNGCNRIKLIVTETTITITTTLASFLENGYNGLGVRG